MLIAYYTQFYAERDPKAQTQLPFKLQEVKPSSYRKKQFPGTITEVSPLFCTIYNESAEAENHKLPNVAGPGYRKSLEFLVKDYLIREHPAKKESIEKTTQLGKLIKENISPRQSQSVP